MPVHFADQSEPVTLCGERAPGRHVTQDASLMDCDGCRLQYDRRSGRTPVLEALAESLGEDLEQARAAARRPDALEPPYHYERPPRGLW